MTNLTTKQKTVKEVECPKCHGNGYTAEHDIPENHHPETGECLTCPIQVQCEYCKSTGRIEV